MSVKGKITFICNICFIYSASETWEIQTNIILVSVTVAERTKEGYHWSPCCLPGRAQRFSYLADPNNVPLEVDTLPLHFREETERLPVTL